MIELYYRGGQQLAAYCCLSPLPPPEQQLHLLPGVLAQESHIRTGGGEALHQGGAAALVRGQAGQTQQKYIGEYHSQHREEQ